MHGEYKVPGGKLVVVDLEVSDGRIADFHLAGDFFLEPDDALADIDRVLVDPGASWTVDPRASASRSRNTPFAGRELPSRVLATFLRGVPTVLDGAPAPA